MAEALRHVGVVVSDMERAVRVYRDYLGCHVVAEYPSVAGPYISKLVGVADARLRIVVVAARDGGRIELLQYVSHPERRRGPVEAQQIGVSHLALTVRDIEKLYAGGSERDVRFVSPPLHNPEGTVKVAYAVVMDEHIVELVEVLEPPVESPPSEASTPP
jgi:catechol 2,3-dioxygenase-like lactoylglutathione lyase family enzyme